MQCCYKLKSNLTKSNLYVNILLGNNNSSLKLNL